MAEVREVPREHIRRAAVERKRKMRRVVQRANRRLPGGAERLGSARQGVIEALKECRGEVGELRATVLQLQMEIKGVSEVARVAGRRARGED